MCMYVLSSCKSVYHMSHVDHRAQKRVLKLSKIGVTDCCENVLETKS